VYLKLEVVRILSLAEGELLLEVVLEQWSLLDSWDQQGIDGLLVLDLGGWETLLVLLLGEEVLLLSLSLGDGLLWSVEVVVVELGVNVETGQVDLGGGGDDVGLVDALEWNSVDLEGTGDKEKTRLELLQEDDTLTTEATRNENEDRTRLDGVSELGGTMDMLSGAESVMEILLRIVRRRRTLDDASLLTEGLGFLGTKGRLGLDDLGGDLGGGLSGLVLGLLPQELVSVGG
jgi:hypothetical protein